MCGSALFVLPPISLGIHLKLRVARWGSPSATQDFDNRTLIWIALDMYTRLVNPQAGVGQLTSDYRAAFDQAHSTSCRYDTQTMPILYRLEQTRKALLVCIFSEQTLLERRTWRMAAQHAHGTWPKNPMLVISRLSALTSATGPAQATCVPPESDRAGDALNRCISDGQNCP
jgi:hypothetical protein